MALSARFSAVQLQAARRPQSGRNAAAQPVACAQSLSSATALRGTALSSAFAPRAVGSSRSARGCAVVAHSTGQMYEGSLDAKGVRIAIVIGRFNDLVTKLLLEGALHGIKRHGGNPDEVPVVWVPGCFEIPLVCKKLGQSGKYDVVIAIGAVVRGATTHYDSVAGAATSGILGAGMDTGVPVVFGVLTCDTMEQAMDRAGGKVGNKGYEAAVTAIEMANLYKVLPVK